MDDGGRRRLTRLAGRKGPLRSFALGGIVGAAGAIATVRRLRTDERPPAGLAAFEDAPCFLERAYGATTGDVVSKPE